VYVGDIGSRHGDYRQGRLQGQRKAFEACVTAPSWMNDDDVAAHTILSEGANGAAHATNTGRIRPKVMNS
jgi:hypothetical protein